MRISAMKKDAQPIMISNRHRVLMKSKSCERLIETRITYCVNIMADFHLRMHSCWRKLTFQARCPSPFGLIANRTDITWTPIRNNDISWNFSKWLIDHNGQPFRRYTPRTEPYTIQEDIRELLKACEMEKAYTTAPSGQQGNTTSNATESASPIASKLRARRTIIYN